MPYYTQNRKSMETKVFARYAEIMPYYTEANDYNPNKVFARYAEIMPYYTGYILQTNTRSLLGMLK